MDPRLYPKAKPPDEAPAKDDGPLFAVEFVKKDGERHGFPYAMLSMASYSPEDGLTVVFGSVRVKAMGTGIDRLYQSLLRRDLVGIAESAGHVAGDSAETQVERITIEMENN